jgi:hypothetical protein
MIEESIRTTRRFAGSAHTDQVRREYATKGQRVRNNVTPHVRRCRVAVKENDGVPLSGFDIGHLGIKYRQSFHVVRKHGTYRTPHRTVLIKYQVSPWCCGRRPVFAFSLKVETSHRLSSIHDREQN